MAPSTPSSLNLFRFSETKKFYDYRRVLSGERCFAPFFSARCGSLASAFLHYLVFRLFRCSRFMYRWPHAHLYTPCCYYVPRCEEILGFGVSEQKVPCVSGYMHIFDQMRRATVISAGASVGISDDFRTFRQYLTVLQQFDSPIVLEFSAATALPTVFANPTIISFATVAAIPT